VTTAPLIPALTPTLAREVEALYNRLELKIRALGVGCWVRGACCNFDRAQHVLYASTLELAFLRTQRATVAQDAQPNGSALCPFWEAGRCNERAGRPLGCRSFFCDARFRPTLEALYETYHQELRQLAAAHQYPWQYLPFVATVRSGVLAETTGTAGTAP
jgi:hypothetical protein